jgi:hypothetical protein
LLCRLLDLPCSVATEFVDSPSDAPDSEGSYDESADSGDFGDSAFIRRDLFLVCASGAASDVTLRACFLVGGAAPATSVRERFEWLVSICRRCAWVLCNFGMSSAL